jgi:hypothetical protein
MQMSELTDKSDNKVKGFAAGVMLNFVLQLVL